MFPRTSSDVPPTDEKKDKAVAVPAAAEEEDGEEEKEEKEEKEEDKHLSFFMVVAILPFLWEKQNAASLEGEKMQKKFLRPPLSREGERGRMEWRPPEGTLSRD